MAVMTLKDGYQIPEASFKTIKMNIENLKDTDLDALIDLVEKCKNPHHSFSRTHQSDSSIILIERSLINKRNEVVHEDVRRIVLNSIERSGQSIRFVNPLKETNRVSLQNSS